MQSMAIDNALSALDVAKLLGVSKNTVYEMVRRGELKSYRVGRKMRFTKEDVDSYIARSHGAKRIKIPPVKSVEVHSGLLNREQDSVFIISGQDVILDILSNYLRERGVPALRAYVGSFESLLMLYQDKVQAATCHLWDGDTDSYNTPYVRRLMPGTNAVLVNLSYRMQGFYVRKGNPKGICSWEDLCREDVYMLNRKKSSASRILLDEKLMQLGMDKGRINGYGKEIGSHITLANAIGRGEADVTVGTQRVCAQVENVEFVPMQEERCDLVIKNDKLNTPEIIALLEILRLPAFKAELEGISGNDYRDIGKVVAEI